MRHSFSGRSIMSMCFTPNSLSASTAAETMLGVEPILLCEQLCVEHHARQSVVDLVTQAERELLHRLRTTRSGSQSLSTKRQQGLSTGREHGGRQRR